MQDPNKVQQTISTSGPTSTTVVGQPTITTNTSSVQDDIVTRASQVLPEQKKDDQNELPGFDRKKHEEILSKLPPEVRSSVDAYQKELFSGANKKFQEAAELRKQAEATRRRPTVSELLQDPDFVKEAQAYAQQQQMNQAPQGSNLTEEEWSALTPVEKETIRQMQVQNQALSTQMSRLLSEQEDTRLKDRYKNYDGTQVDQLQKDLIHGRIQATREHLWKVLNYEDAVKAAYQLGLQDRNSNFQDKQNANSLGNGFNITPSDEVPQKNAGESNIDFFKRLAMRRTAQQQARR